MAENPPVTPISRIVAGPAPWPNLPTEAGRRFRVLLSRMLRRRCPYCGGGNIFSNYWSLKPICPTCEVRYEREEGYFLGAYAVNLVVSESIALGLALGLLFGTGLRDAPLLQQEIIAIGLAVLFPVVLFPYSRGLWMAIDLMLNPPGPREDEHMRTEDFYRARPDQS